MSRMIKRLTRKLDSKDREIAVLKAIIQNQQGQLDYMAGFDPSNTDQSYLEGYGHQQELEHKLSLMSN